ncbi:uncharacterized protein DUF3575 [Dysgonomonas alginatilytica]|uniref:Uncharacterized protein DUF3575 n=1 Tax=Dysgonomonas alginatilytica TaxID=1605892 RepID=A0A2V3PQR8_9BACT|nr:DUF3575 domain-containing protein [Dysgonomonas alginatilytica]PXV59448.1 uncharacterized protein DUF3575 [Dysgonomonas alginatilytica]
MDMYTLFRRLIKSLAFMCVCLPGLLSAQTASIKGAAQTPASVMGRQVNRVADPLSKNTVWFDNYTIKNLPADQQKEGDIAHIVVFHFRVNSILLEPDYMDNARSMELLDRIFSDSTIFSNNKPAVIIGSASPEGYTDLNEKLAIGRSLATKKYIMDTHPHIDRDRIATYAVDEDWQGFRKIVMADIYMPARNQAIEILDREISGKQKLDALQKLNGGTTYRYIQTNIFPYLRGGVSCTFYTPDTPKNEAATPLCPPVEYRDRVVEIVRTDTIYIDQSTRLLPVKSPAQNTTLNNKKPYYLAIKTNVLYGLALLPNLAIELSLGKRWSVEVEGMESWWNTKNDKRYNHRIQTAGLEVRKWLGSHDRTPLNGHFLGVYGMGGTYDVKYQKEKGELSNWSYSAGISYGYAMPIARRFNLEFAIGIGYVAGEYKNYTYDFERSCYSRVDAFNRSYLGLTKAKISLVWLIGSGVNKQKENKR